MQGFILHWMRQPQKLAIVLFSSIDPYAVASNQFRLQLLTIKLLVSELGPLLVSELNPLLVSELNPLLLSELNPLLVV